MASPASTATMAAESIDGDMPMDIDDDQATSHQVNQDNEDVQPIRSLSNQESDEGVVLLERYTNPSEKATLSPLMLAARNPDPQILEDILQEAQLSYDTTNPEDGERQKLLNSTLDPIPGDEFGPSCCRYNQDVGITTPLLEAIRAGLPENVQVLLDEGADPLATGLPSDLMESYSAFFPRFRPAIPPDPASDVASRTDFLERMNLPQLSTLTTEEVEDRFWHGMAPFWCEQDFVPANFFPNGEAIPAIVEAARSGSIGIADQIINSGADTTFWMTPQFFVPGYNTHSSLSVSSPIHAALQARDINILNHLLCLGFDPNTMPLANPTRCFTPLMAVII